MTAFNKLTTARPARALSMNHSVAVARPARGSINHSMVTAHPAAR